MKDNFVNIAVNFPVGNSILTYKNADFDFPIREGALVEVPLGRRKEKGCVLSFSEDPPDPKVKYKLISGSLSKDLHIPKELIEFFTWISEYYHYPLGQLIFDCIPKILKRERKLNFIEGQGEQLDFEFSPEQKSIIDDLQGRSDGFSRALIHGITGSGKTAIYLQKMKEALAKGKSVLFLVPEINLTPQFTQTLSRFLPHRIYQYNSSISNSDKFGLWKELLNSSEPMVVIGVRSSIFLPFSNLGLIIVDEEHDQSFKQDDRCPYNGRDIAIKRASLLKIPIILGSATPSMESYYLAKKTNSYFKMINRPGTSRLPDIEFVDISQNKNTTEEKDFYLNSFPISLRVYTALEQCFAKDEQAVILINRLGFANVIQCKGCGHKFDCRNCSTNLKYYRKDNSLKCQHCTYIEPFPDSCPVCGNLSLVQKGFGTEKVVAALANLFPHKNFGKFDRDEIKTTAQLEENLQSFEKQEIDVFVGTQMLSKGHNFKRVNLVIVLGVDSQLNFPDFRSNEKVFQLLTQVAGRAGRYGKDSKVLIQTLCPENGIYGHVEKHSFDEFHEEELDFRKALELPPFSKMISLYFIGKNVNKVMDEAIASGELIKSIAKNHFPAVEVLGPKPATIEKRVNQFTWCLLLKSSDVKELHSLLLNYKNNRKTNSLVSLKVDVDPQFIQ